MRIDDTAVHEALREDLENAVIHANYYDRRGLVIEKKKDEIIISNQGGLRISIDEAVNGVISDPRNTNLFKMFSLVNIGERAGSGLHSIYSIWKSSNMKKLVLAEVFNPDRRTLNL